MTEYDSLSLIYKIKNSLAPEHTRQMFEGFEDIHNHNTRSVRSGNFYIKKMNTSKGQTRFACSESLKSSVSLFIFRRNLKKHVLEMSSELVVINSIQQFFPIAILCIYKHILKMFTQSFHQLLLTDTLL